MIETSINKCVECNQPIPYNKFYNKRSIAKTYSKLCRKQYQSKYRKERYKKKINIKDFKCTVCNEPRTSRSKFCSPICKQSAIKSYSEKQKKYYLLNKGKYLRRSEKQYIKTKLARHVVKNEDLKCVICEKKKDNLRWKTCSEECSLKLARQTRSRLSKQSYVRKQMDKENIVLCSFCHKNSFKRIGNNKFCSPVCKENNLKQLKEKIKGVLVNNLLCSNCHKSFKHYDQRRRYCSVECSTISNTLRQKKQCKICEKEFAGCRTTQSCSQKCSTILKIATLNNWEVKIKQL